MTGSAEMYIMKPDVKTDSSGVITSPNYPNGITGKEAYLPNGIL